MLSYMGIHHRPDLSFFGQPWLKGSTTLLLLHRQQWLSLPPGNFSSRDPSLNRYTYYKTEETRIRRKAREGNKGRNLRKRDCVSNHRASFISMGPPLKVWRLSSVTSFFQPLSSSGIERIHWRKSSYSSLIIGHSWTKEKKRMAWVRVR